MGELREVDLSVWRQRAEFWTTRDPSTIGHLYDESAVKFAGEVLYLLDRLDAAEAAVERVRAMLAAWDAWDGSPGPDGRTHPDASSPRDRERLRRALEGRGSHVEAPGSAERGAGGVDGRSEGLEGRSGGMG